MSLSFKIQYDVQIFQYSLHSLGRRVVFFVFFIIAYDVCCCCYTQYTSDDNDAMLLIIIEISWMNNIFHEYQLPKSTTFQFIYFMQCFLYSESALNKLLFLCSFVYLYVSPYF